MTPDDLHSWGEGAENPPSQKVSELLACNSCPLPPSPPLPSSLTKSPKAAGILRQTGVLNSSANSS